jgi:methylmalonyl-CoA mutase C-terminal domain/subunit
MIKEERKIRVLIANPGYDGHWKGARVTMALRDAGMEVVYIGNQVPEAIQETAIQEDVDVIGLNILAPESKQLVIETLNILQKEKEKTKSFLVIIGADLTPKEEAYLKDLGASGIFPLKVNMDLVVEHVEKNISQTELQQV